MSLSVVLKANRHDSGLNETVLCCSKELSKKHVMTKVKVAVFFASVVLEETGLLVLIVLRDGRHVTPSW